MQINLTVPSISFGTGNFNVDEYGILTAKGVNLSSSTYEGKPFSEAFVDDYQGWELLAHCPHPFPPIHHRQRISHLPQQEGKLLVSQ